MPLSVFGVLCFAASVVLMAKRKAARRTQAVLMFVAGLGLFAGLVGRARDAIDALATSASASGTAKLFGVGVPFVLAFGLVFWFALDMDVDGLVNKLRKRGGTNNHVPGRATPWLALLVPVALAVLPVVGGLPDAARHGVAQLASLVG